MEDSFRLAARIFASGFRPHFIVGIWRGGAPVGIAVQEYFEFRGAQTDHIAIRTSSYAGIGEQAKTIRVHGLQYIIENVNADDSLLIVDDVFDSGRSVEAVLAELAEKTRRNMPQDLRIACPWYKPQHSKVDNAPRRGVGFRAGSKREGCRTTCRCSNANALLAIKCRFGNNRWPDVLDRRACRTAAA